MATRGAKPKPAHLRLVDGIRNATRHGSEADLRKKADKAVEAFGKLAQPTHLKGEAAKAWKRYIAPASWLDASREPAAVAFCELWEEFRSCPPKFTAGKHGQLRAYMSELGLTDERNRGDDDKQEKDEFFD
jgi:phage terminase small subunit